MCVTVVLILTNKILCQKYLSVYSEDKLGVLRNTYNLKVVTIWECMWEKAKQIDPDVMAFMSNYTAPE